LDGRRAQAIERGVQVEDADRCANSATSPWGYDSPTDIASSGSISDLAENGFVR